MSDKIAPKDWEVKRLGDICEKITDGSHNLPKGIDYSEYLMLSSKNVFNDCIDGDSPRYLTKADFENENIRTDVKTGDVLLTIVGF
jgi:type I restriction enzyme S subunit